MQELWNAFGHSLTNILPKSPFASFIDSAQEWPGLAWLNWVCPVGELIQIFGAWLACVAAFFLVQIVLRWVKVIQG